MKKYNKDFTHIAVPIKTRQKLAIMAAVLNARMYDLARDWIDDNWQDLLVSGKVSDRMLEPIDKK